MGYSLSFSLTLCGDVCRMLHGKYAGFSFGTSDIMVLGEPNDGSSSRVEVLAKRVLCVA